jgi:hypothetical protein
VQVEQDERGAQRADPLDRLGHRADRDDSQARVAGQRALHEQDV